VGGPGIPQGGRRVHGAAGRRDDSVNDLQEMGVVAEGDARALELAASLDVNFAGSVDEDVGDRRILHERLDRAEPEGLVLDLDDEIVTLLPTQGGVVERQHVLDDPADLLLDELARQHIELGEIEPLDELAVDTSLELVVRRLASLPGIERLADDGCFLARPVPALEDFAASRLAIAYR